MKDIKRGIIQKEGNSMITIEPISHEDLMALNGLYEELMGVSGSLSRMNTVYDHIAANSQYRLLGAKCDGELAGSITCILCWDLVGDCRPFMLIENVVVSSRFRRLGIGNRLMEHAEHIARSYECTCTMLISGAQRTEAHRFYEALGYTVDVKGFKKML
ncbi:GNAT family N-acetyltransferase [Paenibacillus sp. UMB4589-SE434]|uniref:GNAT family N-acetyltransferase n=1 Tax=Paenibacillus sp. UMB4589-SE434 TaxID=3046314 RepID=UPI00254A8D5E|nr:GNAT family N-acetyltransferase [Paenibacillus sp. UMB4589-SE434]MDK8183632.1 GNAT family N-acetyltransferase [Paenibacillus sp. UMB4589-SE434]